MSEQGQVDDLSVVLGATGGIGGALVRQLAGSGRRVRAVSRSGGLPFGVASDAPVDAVAADVRDADAVAAVARGAATVYHAAQADYTRWPQDFPPLTRAVAQGVGRAGAKLVMVDNLYPYGPTGGAVMTEESPWAATDRKGRTRALMAEELLAAHAAGTVRVTLGRPSSYHGPGGLRSLLGPQVFGSALAGHPAQWVGPLDVPTTISFLPDVARALVVLGDDDAADGRVWHLPNAEALTGEQFLRHVFAAAGTPYQVQAADRAVLEHLAAQDPFLAEVLDIYFHAEEPYLVDHTAFEKAFGPFAVTPHAEAVATTTAWFAAAS